MGACYFPCQSSFHFDLKMFDDLVDDVISFDLPVFLLGDLNARTGKLNDMLNFEDYVAKHFGLSDNDYLNIQNDLISNNVSLERKNEDLKINQAGREIIDVCKSLGLVIVNGRLSEDKNIGKFTCHNRNQGKSTIDYAIMSPLLLQNISHFSVCEFDDMLSDTHCAISLVFRTKNRIPSQ